MFIAISFTKIETHLNTLRVEKKSLMAIKEYICFFENAQMINEIEFREIMNLIVILEKTVENRTKLLEMAIQEFSSGARKVEETLRELEERTIKNKW